MLNSMEVSKFKAFNKTQTANLKKITLIFGPNSAGKSSLLQSLLLLKQTKDEIINEDSALITKGKLVNLGNYQEMVYSHQCEEKIIIANEFKLSHSFKRTRWYGIIDNVKYESIFSYDNSGFINLYKLNIYINGNINPFITIKKSDKKHKVYKTMRVTRNIRGLQSNDFIIEKINYEDPLIENFRKNYNAENRITSIKNELGKEAFEDRLRKDQECLVLNITGFLITGIGVDLDNENINHGFHDRTKLDDLLMNISINYNNELSAITYLGPLREYPERHYIFSGSSPVNVGKSGGNMSDLLFINQSLIKDVNYWLDKFGIDYYMKINRLMDKEISDVYSMRLIDKVNNVSVSPMDVGFGISQILPIIVQGLISKNSIICIEQPEIHIHPRLQTVFGSFLVECIKQNNQFIIETHSEHILLRLKKLIKEKQISNEDVCVMYVDRTEDGSKCLELRLDDDGDFIDEWPDGFFEEGYREVFY